MSQLNDTATRISIDIKNVENREKMYQQVYDGAKVYCTRNEFVVMQFCLIGIWLLSKAESVQAFCLMTFLSYFNTDLYTGILHVVLDDEQNLEFPILGPAALEFQWHHKIPTDIALKPEMQALADLNRVVVGIFIFYFCCFGINNIIGPLLGLKLFFSYLAQAAHRSSHSLTSKRNPIINVLQNLQILIPVSEHARHHITNKVNFSILNGTTNNLINFLYSLNSNSNFWRFIFTFTTMFDVFILSVVARIVLS